MPATLVLLRITDSTFHNLYLKFDIELVKKFLTIMEHEDSF